MKILNKKELHTDCSLGPRSPLTTNLGNNGSHISLLNSDNILFE